MWPNDWLSIVWGKKGAICLEFGRVLCVCSWPLFDDDEDDLVTSGQWSLVWFTVCGTARLFYESPFPLSLLGVAVAVLQTVCSLCECVPNPILFFFCSNSSGCKPIFVGLEVHSSSLSRVRCRRCCRQYQQRLFLPLLLLLLLLLLPLWLECPTLSPALLYHQHQHDWALFTLFAFFFFLLLLYLFSWPVLILPVCNCGGLHLACLTWTATSGPRGIQHS